MRIGIVGAGRVGGTLGERWAEVGHEITYGVRSPDNTKYARLREYAELVLPEMATAGAEVILLAVPWAAARDAAASIGSVGDAVVIDATNPLAADSRGHERTDLSGAEQIRDWLDGGRVVKAFNTTGAGNMADPVYSNVPPMMPLAGDDEEAKRLVGRLADEIGFDPVDAGPLSAARDLEHMAVLWIRLAYTLGNGPDIAFALLRR